ncbi:hypothetical protein CDAR_287221 [Caerostris darwini]|uniref:Uncharacterized protein n=1 Tax=Caerostris darwini TaxID=1538125 RepID=A0AAV4UID8_9ARAC|nr:hypothetical protein CDAR_287221 [Caerostris darwini]
MHPFSDCFFCLPNSLHFSRNAYIIQQNQPFCHGLLQRGKHPLARTQSTHGSDPKSQKSHSPLTENREDRRPKSGSSGSVLLIEALQEDAGVLFSDVSAFTRRLNF